MDAIDEEDLETYVEGFLDGFRVSRESTFVSPPPSPLPPDSKKNKKNKKDKKPKKDKKGQKDMTTVKKSKKDKKNKKDTNGKNDKKDEKAKKTEKGIMRVIIKPSSTCQKDESIMTLHVVGSDTIGKVKRLIEHNRQLEGRPPAIRLCLIFGNTVLLADANTLMFYNIPDNAHLRLEVMYM